ncbi:BLUF domain-containing protein [Actinomycetospora endophytica]|uniref:BLUF domain-containing protein n=1 Tax=Actinomycetospora endophytica TaxID=2291215 RepID=A0ABS8P0U9_9PSEU|nr:BLUF domain-containing protein [Actinomycetospora endophytica]MCD2191868.1 BLUF domain-containing protein [Actinomycetospora endophytica]
MVESGASTGGGPVFRLIYRSSLKISGDDLQVELPKILAAARRKNPEQGITGALVVWEDSVVQTLEGEESAVRGLYDTIQRDPRHEQVELVETAAGVDRAFPRWSMARVTDDDEADLPLSVNQWEGGIDVTAPRLQTPAEEAVIASMRNRVRGAPA